MIINEYMSNVTRIIDAHYNIFTTALCINTTIHLYEKLSIILCNFPSDTIIYI